MSRSYRRSEIIKYAGDTSWKKIFNRKLRRKYKNDLDFPKSNMREILAGKRFLIASFAANIRMTLISLTIMPIVK